MRKIILKSLSSGDLEGQNIQGFMRANPTWLEAFNAYNEALACLNQDNKEAAHSHFEQACQKLLEIKRHFQALLYKDEIPAEMTAENKAGIGIYIQAITHLAQLNLQFEKYQEAKPYLEEFLKLSDYTTDSKANDYFNLALIYQNEYETTKNSESLFQSTEHFIRSLMEYRRKAPQEVASSISALIENTTLAAKLMKNDRFVYEDLSECEKDILNFILAEVLDENQLKSLVNWGDTGHQFFVEKKWQESLLDKQEGLTAEQIERIKTHQLKRIPNLTEKNQERESNHDSLATSDELVNPNGQKPQKERDHAMRKNAIKDELLNKAFSEAFTNFEKTYDNGKVKKYHYHPVLPGTNTLKRVLYIIPPQEYQNSPQVEEFVKKVIEILQRQNSDKYCARNVNGQEIVKKLPNNEKEWSKTFKNVKVNSSGRGVLKDAIVNLEDKPMGTVGVALTSAVDAYFIFENYKHTATLLKPLPTEKAPEKKKSSASKKVSDQKNETKGKEPQPAKNPAQPVFSPPTIRFKTVAKDPKTGENVVHYSKSSSSSSLESLVEVAREEKKRARPPESTGSREQHKKSVGIRKLNSVGGEPTWPPSKFGKSKDESLGSNTNTGVGRIMPLPKPRTTPLVQMGSVGFEKFSERDRLAKAYVEASKEDQSPKAQPDDKAKSPEKEKSPREKKPASLPPSNSSEQLFSPSLNRYALFAQDPAVLALIKAKEEEEKLAEAAKAKAQELKAKVVLEIKPALKEAKNEVEREREKFLEILKEEVATRKREREEAEEERKQTEKRLEEKSAKLKTLQDKIKACRENEEESPGPALGM